MAASDIESLSMFCFQCEQTAKGEGCTVRGVCTKYFKLRFLSLFYFSRDPKIAALQDHIIWGLQSLSVWAMKAMENNTAIPEEAYMFVAKVTSFVALPLISFLVIVRHVD